ncbi:MAG: hypothetical protein AAGU16_00600 [Desulfitobacterium hafniense]
MDKINIRLFKNCSITIAKDSRIIAVFVTLFGKRADLIFYRNQKQTAE